MLEATLALLRWTAVTYFAIATLAYGQQSVRLIEWSQGKVPIALVFVHGLGGCSVARGAPANSACAGSAKDSFRNESTGQVWMELVVSDRQTISTTNPTFTTLSPSQLGIWSIDYSSLTTSQCPDYSVADVADHVRIAVEQSGIQERYERIVFVAHSMGGLVVKQMIVSSASQSGSRLSQQIPAVFLLGVPSQGSPLAPSSDIARYLGALADLFRRLNVCERQVRDLTSDSGNTYLQNLENTWLSMLDARRKNWGITFPLTYCAIETRVEPVIAQRGITVVDRIYASTSCSGPPTKIPTFHTALPKPMSAQSDVHKLWLRANLGAMMSEWTHLPAVRFDFRRGQDDLDAFRRWVNDEQKAFRLDVAPAIAKSKPSQGSYTAATIWELTHRVAQQNSSLICIVASDAMALEIRASGACPKQ